MKKRNQNLYADRITLLEAENERLRNREADKGNDDAGVNTRRLRLNPSTSRDAMVLYEIFGPAVSKRRRIR